MYGRRSTSARRYSSHPYGIAHAFGHTALLWLCPRSSVQWLFAVRTCFHPGTVFALELTQACNSFIFMYTAVLSAHAVFTNGQGKFGIHGVCLHGCSSLSTELQYVMLSAWDNVAPCVTAVQNRRVLGNNGIISAVKPARPANVRASMHLL